MEDASKILALVLRLLPFCRASKGRIRKGDEWVVSSNCSFSKLVLFFGLREGGDDARDFYVRGDRDFRGK